MKRILLSFIAIAIATLSSFGQSPEGFKYQAVIRDAGNLILTNQAVGMQLTIQQGSIGGTAVYTEAFSPTSNAFGLVNLEIGTGMSTDDFTIIDWANGPYFMETAVDITGGMTYEVMGTSQLMSVPYALYAKTSGNGEGPQGPTGAAGAVGAQGPAGENGNDGVPGPQGLQGPAGADSTVPGPTGPAGADSTVPGPAGADGINGQDGIDGAQGIQGPAGENGINGPDGITGAQGPQGLTGPAGTNGIDGIDGDDGTQGSTGLTGPAGANGNDGAAGATGLQGPIGLTGPAGANGTNGNDGATGSDGQDGDDGITGQSAYDVWISLGNTGSEADFISSLTGPQGNDGVVDYDSLANIISVDSSFTANVSGSIGGGCDFSFPEGLDGEVITSAADHNIGYTVPSGKKLYILNYTSVPASTQYGILINGINIGINPNSTLILNPGDVLNAFNGSAYVSFNGYLTDSSPTITSITNEANQNIGYTVPSGKKLYVLAHAPSTLQILINGLSIGYAPNDPLILNPGDVLSSINSNADVRFNGYLADENYFANCGGGSSNSASNATIDSLSQVVSTLDSTLTALTSLFVFGCMDPAAFNYNSSANINDGSCNFIPSIGDTYQGGIIFYLDGNGGGLIAAPSNQSSGASEWGCIGTSIGTGTAIGSGFQNTAMIELGCATPNTAADVCANLTLGGYNDWFLPSRYELVEMHQNIGQGNALGLGNIGGFANNYYWSSSEAFGGSSTAWIKYFGITTSGVNSWNKDELEYVRAIRVF
ncbi:MAG: DUF1566 domain-containing protein [Flavobacteriales bacterium]